MCKITQVVMETFNSGHRVTKQTEEFFVEVERNMQLQASDSTKVPWSKVEEDFGIGNKKLNYARELFKKHGVKDIKGKAGAQLGKPINKKERKFRSEQGFSWGECKLLPSDDFLTVPSLCS